MNQKEKPHFLINFMIRAFTGMVIIYVANLYLDYRGISVAVGMNAVSFLTSGMLGLPGISLLYGILFYQNL